MAPKKRIPVQICYVILHGIEATRDLQITLNLADNAITLKEKERAFLAYLKVGSPARRLMKKRSLIFSIVLVIAFSPWMVGCGMDDEDETEDLYTELVGTYNLFKAELTYPNQPV